MNTPEYVSRVRPDGFMVEYRPDNGSHQFGIFPNPVNSEEYLVKDMIERFPEEADFLLFIEVTDDGFQSEVVDAKLKFIKSNGEFKTFVISYRGEEKHIDVALPEKQNDESQETSKQTEIVESVNTALEKADQKHKALSDIETIDSREADELAAQFSNQSSLDDRQEYEDWGDLVDRMYEIGSVGHVSLANAISTVMFADQVVDDPMQYDDFGSLVSNSSFDDIDVFRGKYVYTGLGSQDHTILGLIEDILDSEDVSYATAHTRLLDQKITPIQDDVEEPPQQQAAAVAQTPGIKMEETFRYDNVIDCLKSKNVSDIAEAKAELWGTEDSEIKNLPEGIKDDISDIQNATEEYGNCRYLEYNKINKMSCSENLKNLIRELCVLQVGKMIAEQDDIQDPLALAERMRNRLSRKTLNSRIYSSNITVRSFIDEISTLSEETDVDPNIDNVTPFFDIEQLDY